MSWGRCARELWGYPSARYSIEIGAIRCEKSIPVHICFGWRFGRCKICSLALWASWCIWLFFAHFCGSWSCTTTLPPSLGPPISLLPSSFQAGLRPPSSPHQSEQSPTSLRGEARCQQCLSSLFPRSSFEPIVDQGREKGSELQHLLCSRGISATFARIDHHQPQLYRG